MAFFLLLAATALLFNRPSDWVPALAGVPLFQIVIACCLALSINKCSSHLRSTSIRSTPITICVVWLFVVAFVSQLASSTNSVNVLIDFAKACVFYLLVVAIVDSPKRASIFTKAVGVSIFFVGFLMVLSHHTTLFGSAQPLGGVEEMRTEAVGGANFDANDTAALLVLAALIFLATAIDTSTPILRLIWIALAAVVVYGIQLTNSRAGFLALIIGVAVYLWVRWGTKGIKWGMLLLPLGAAMVATDRMTDIGGAIQHGTGQSRLQMTSMGLSTFFHNPILGVGPGEYENHIGKACHNSFIQAYAELGFFGGALFLLAFYLAIRLTFQTARKFSLGEIGSPQTNTVVYVGPALIAAYCASILTLNHLYGAHTYLFLALGTVIPSVYGLPSAETARFIHGGLLQKLGVVSVAFIVLIYVACLVLVRW